MSHFTVLVIGDNPEDQLAKYDESLEVKTIIPKADLIAKEKQYVENYKNGTYAEFLADPKAYKEGCSNEGHINYLENEFPKKLEWTDEDFYQEAIRHIEEKNINEDGSVTSYYNPDSKWDWYQLGGRWTGFFLKKVGASGTQGSPGIMTKAAAADRIDQGRKRDIDFDGMYNQAADEAGSQWDSIKELFGGSIPVLIRSWKDICDDDSLNTKALRLATYEAQDAVVAYKLLQEKYPRDSVEFKALNEAQQEFLHGFHWGSPILDSFACSRDEFVGRAMANAVSTFAVVKDGKWYEKGKMGWWAMVSDEKETKSWNEEFYKLINEAPEDTLFSLYDCHI